MGGAKVLDVGEIRDRLGLIRERVTHRGGTGVKIVAVTKTWGAEALIAAHEVG